MASSEAETRSSWEEVRRRVRPFDLIMFRGSDLVSDAIRVLEKGEVGDGEFSHCGLVITNECLPGVPQLADGAKYVWESTCSYTFGGILGDEPPDAISRKPTFGVQIRHLDEVVPSYLGGQGSSTMVAWCPLIDNPWDPAGADPAQVSRARAELRDKMSTMLAKWGDSPYDANPVALLSAVFPSLRKLRYVFKEVEREGHKIMVSTGLTEPGEGRRSFFCSELVADVYRHIGVIPAKVEPGDYVPVDFLGRGTARLPCLVRSIVQIRRETQDA